MSSLKMLQQPAPISEFVTVPMIADIIKRSSAFVRSINITAGVPSKLDGDGKSLYRWTEIKKRLERNGIMPPDEDHPFHRYTIAETADILGTRVRRVYRWIDSGKIPLQKNESGTQSYIFRKDIEWFRRNYDRQVLISNIDTPLKVNDTCIIMDMVRRTLFRHRKEIPALPRKPRHPKRFAQSTLMAFTNSAIQQKARFRHNPMPEYMTREIARIYLGLSETQIRHYTQKNLFRSREVELENGRIVKRYIKSELDEIMLREAMVEAYCEGKPYYNRGAIERKFGKTRRWVDEYIINECRRIDVNGNILPPRKDGTIAGMACGWHRGDVEHAVQTCGDEHLTLYVRAADRERERARKRHEADLLRERKKKLTERERKVAEREKAIRLEKAQEKARKKAERKAEKKLAAAAIEPTPKVSFHTPLDQIEAAIDAGFAARSEENEEKKKAANRMAHEKRRTRDAIRDTLNLVTSYPDAGFTMWNRLPYSESREIFTILFNRNGSQSRGGSMRYMAYPHEGDEYIIHVTDRKAVSRTQKSDTSIPRLIARGIESIEDKDLKYMPAWVIIAPTTSYVPDPRFLDILRAVPDEYSAVAPYGYGYVLEDGSHDTCTRTYGMYSMYRAETASAEFVVGSEVGKIAPVAAMDGPFVAVRGECMHALSDLSFFTGLGECRSMVALMISAVCRRRGITMASIPVNSVSCADYILPKHSVQWNAIMGKISDYATSP